MPLTFYALDNEFAASTGANVGSGVGTSRFDNPPSGSKDLIISANPDDPDPRVFELGDTYDVSFGGHGGSVLEDAVVIRSDSAGNGGAIVFEGVDANGAVVQVVWTPDFDLENWYWSNYNPSAEPGFYTSDQNPNYDHKFVCFAWDTLIDTPYGAEKAGHLQVGDRVWTKDRGDQVVRWVGQRRLSGVGVNAPVVFAPGAIGNDRPLRLSQQHRVLINSPLVQLYFGEEAVLAPAKALVNGYSVRLQACRSIAYVHLLLDHHELIAAEGASCETMFLGDMAAQLLAPDELVSRQFDGLRQTPARPILSTREARLLSEAVVAPKADHPPHPHALV